MYESQIVISALGQDKPGIVNTLSKTVLDCGGNISDSRMTRLGDEFAMIMLVECPETIVSTIENAVQALQENEGLTITSKKTTLKAQKPHMLYQANVVCMDQPGIVHQITDYLAQQHINIEELDTGSYAAAHTGAPMFALDMTISIPASVNTAEFKQNFLSFCDELNLDAVVDAIQ